MCLSFYILFILCSNLSSIYVVFQHEQQIHRPFWGKHDRHNKIHARKSFFGKQTLILLFYQMSIVTWPNILAIILIFEKHLAKIESPTNIFLKNAPFDLHIGENLAPLCFNLLRKSHVMLQKFPPSRIFSLFSYIFANNFQEMQKWIFAKMQQLTCLNFFVENIMLLYEKNWTWWDLIQRFLSERTFMLPTPFFFISDDLWTLHLSYACAFFALGSSQQYENLRVLGLSFQQLLFCRLQGKKFFYWFLLAENSAVYFRRCL